ncbi:F-box protein At1g61340-like [Rosa rugosa]|uniref:F-box protein At1g61340-like n=1 Tax=Rosa rugosa TaxID=74645 RepID=UPI002B406A38|nr:F-box protein At1g61340-like [Rosa rugosa]
MRRIHIRVLLSWSPNTPLKKQRSECFDFESKLEALPQETLIKILCGVDNEDLKQLFHVSKAIREATLIAKQWHFAYSTPRNIRTNDDLDEIEAPNAPSRKELEERYRLTYLEEGMRKGFHG